MNKINLAYLLSCLITIGLIISIPIIIIFGFGDNGFLEVIMLATIISIIITLLLGIILSYSNQDKEVIEK